jgi:hypothetical protein
MTEAKAVEKVAGVRVLSLLLAGLLWLGVTLERPGELKLQVPVVPEGVPSGLQLAYPPPGALQATLSGPRILLLRQWLCGAQCRLDLSGAQPGPASYGALDCDFGLDHELKVVRVHPQAIRLTLAKAPNG